VITGATSGIGAAAAVALARTGANVVVIGRSESRGRKLAERINGHPRGGQAEFLLTDLSSQREVRALAQTIAERHRSVDALINNAGARFDTYGRTSDGLERTFATNHLSHFLLTCLLLENLMRAPQGRVINVSSGSHGAATATGDWQPEEAAYDRKAAYARSKLANILFTVELARRLAGTNVIVNAVDPGGVASRFALNNGLVSWLKHLVAHALRRDLVLPRTGAETIVYLAAAAEMAGVTGKLFRQKREFQPSEAACDPRAAEELWALSVQWTGLDERLGPMWPRIRP
jgi:NAD(P)-dependent dehydrogenase (short-subunit alcohol dehydrogenase family)